MPKRPRRVEEKQSHQNVEDERVDVRRYAQGVAVNIKAYYTSRFTRRLAYSPESEAEHGDGPENAENSCQLDDVLLGQMISRV